VGAGGLDPDIAMFLTAEARFVDTATGRPTWMRGLAYESPRHKASAWTGHDGELLSREMKRAYLTLAERIVDSVLLQTEFWVGRDALMRSVECGVVPVNPKPQRASPLFGAMLLEAPTVNSLAPSLVWEALPSGSQESVKTPWARARDLRYDLRIWKALDAAPGDMIYARQGLTQTQHQVEIVLEPGSTYFWSVRLRYTVDGHPRATRWAASNVPEYVPSTVMRDALFYAQTEAGRAEPVPCVQKDLTPCGCLDFLASQNLYQFRTP